MILVIELIMAHVLATQGKEGSIEQRFRNFLLYIAQSGLKSPSGRLLNPVNPL